MKTCIFLAVVLAGSIVQAQQWVMMVPTVKAVPVQPACEYTTRWRPIMGGWVTRSRLRWVPVQQAVIPQPQSVVVKPEVYVYEQSPAQPEQLPAPAGLPSILKQRQGEPTPAQPPN